jgi:hypothetical protein
LTDAERLTPGFRLAFAAPEAFAPDEAEALRPRDAEPAVAAWVEPEPPEREALAADWLEPVARAEPARAAEALDAACPLFAARAAEADAWPAPLAAAEPWACAFCTAPEACDVCAAAV